MKWLPHRIILPLIVGFSLTGVSAALLYLLFKKDGSDSINNSRKTYVRTSRQNTLEFKVPRECVSSIIGNDGTSIREIQDSTATYIRFSNDDVRNPERSCVIRGAPENIRLAENIIRGIIVNQPLIKTHEMYISERACGRIIGRGGDSIKQIQKSSRARIIVTRPTGDADTQRKIIIKGTSEQIDAAVLQIEDRIRTENIARRELEANLALRLPRGKISNTTRVQSAEHISDPIESLTTQNPDGLIEVYVSAMETPSQFWIQVISPSLIALDKLVSEMTEYYDNEENREIHILKDVTVGQIVSARYSFDNRWYRAEIISIADENECEICFVDYGDHDKMNAGDVLELRTDFLSLRRQAIECSLAGVKPWDGEWSEEACDVFADLTHLAKWRTLIVKVKGYTERVPERGKCHRGGSLIPYVDLFDKHNGINIGRTLINMAHAEPEESIGSSVSSSSTSASKRIYEIPVVPISTSTSPLTSHTARSDNLIVDTHEPPDVIDDLSISSMPDNSIQAVDSQSPGARGSSQFMDDERQVHEDNGSDDYVQNSSLTTFNGGYEFV